MLLQLANLIIEEIVSMTQNPGSMVIWPPIEGVEPEPLLNSFVRYTSPSLNGWGISVPATTACMAQDLVAKNHITHPYEPLPPGQILSAIKLDDRIPTQVPVQNPWGQQSTSMETRHTTSGHVSTSGRVRGAPHSMPNLSLVPPWARDLQKFRAAPSAFPNTPARAITYTLLGIRQLQDEQSLALREIELADLRAMKNWPRNRRPLATWEIFERERDLQVESVGIRRRMAERERRPEYWGGSGPTRGVRVSVQRPARLSSRSSRSLASIGDRQNSNLQQRTPPMTGAEGNFALRNSPPIARGEPLWALKEYDEPVVVSAPVEDPPSTIPPASNEAVSPTGSGEGNTQATLRGGPGVPGGRTWAAGWSQQPLYVMRCMIQYFFASMDRWSRQPFYALRGVMRDYNYGSRATKAQAAVLWEYEERRIERAEARMEQQLATIDGEDMSEYYEADEVVAGAVVSGKV